MSARPCPSRRGGAGQGQEAVEGRGARRRSPSACRSTRRGPTSSPGWRSAPSCSRSASSCWSRWTFPPRPSAPPARAVGEAGFTVSGYQIVGINHMNRALDRRGRHRRAAPRCRRGRLRARRRRRWSDVAEIRQPTARLRLDQGCARVAAASRHAWSSTSSSARPRRLWQNQGQLALIDAEGVVLDRVPVDKMPDLPLLIGPGANGQAAAARQADGRGADVEAAARVGNLGRRPPLGPQLPVRRDGRASRRRGRSRGQR